MRAGKRPGWVAPAVVAVLAGVCYYWLSGPFVKPKPERNTVLAAPEQAVGAAAAPAGGPPMPDGPVEAAVAAAVETAPRVDPVAMEYISAYQEGGWDDVIRLTCWMQDRLARVTDAETAAAMAALRERSAARTLDANQLREEGVEDQYVFAPGATVTPLGMDSGRADLERPARDRTWVRVTYPERPSALRDTDGLAIRSLVVGVNVSEEGLVLKANVVGNLDIDTDSIQTYWRSSKETGHGVD